MRIRSTWLYMAVVGGTSVFAAQSSSPGGVGVGPRGQVLVETSRTLGPIDLTRYALGQGGLSKDPMITDRVEQIAQLHPQTIHIFLQEYLDLYPAHGRYHWDDLDRNIEVIRATGAAPVVSICFKPKVLYPDINDQQVAPNDYDEWEKLIYELVRHCSVDRKCGVKYWIVANEGDIGEPGGVPYKFRTVQSYLEYYAHTSVAILRADPDAKVGGPSPANASSPQIDALIAAAGEGKVPLGVLSFHGYHNDPKDFAGLVGAMRAKLAKYPALRDLPTFIDQWNMDLFKPILNPYFQPALVLETTLAFQRSGLTGAAYYQIRDYFVDTAVFSRFLSPQGTREMAYWWNEMPQYDGLYDNQNRVRPAYYAFKLLSTLRGEQLPVTSTVPAIRTIAARQGRRVNLVLWNYPAAGENTRAEATIRFPSEKNGAVRLVRLNAEAAVNNFEEVRDTKIPALTAEPLRLTVRPYEIYWVEVTE